MLTPFPLSLTHSLAPSLPHSLLSLYLFPLFLTAQNGEERDRWFQALDSTIRRLKQPLQVCEI